MGTFDETVDFVDLRFIGTYESDFDVDFYGLEYRYSLINNNRVDAGFSAGCSSTSAGASRCRPEVPRLSIGVGFL